MQLVMQRALAPLLIGVALSGSAFFFLQACSDADAPTEGGAGNGVEDAGLIDAQSADTSTTTSDGEANSDSNSNVDGEPPGEPTVRFVGRFDTMDPAGPIVNWEGARVIYRFVGTSLTVKLTEVDESDLADGGPDPSRYDVIIDGTVQTAPLTPTKGAADYVVASNLGSGVHVVELWRRTETYVGKTQFRGFDLAAGGQLLAPLPAPTHRIEIIGDSASNGYGVECLSPQEGFSGATQNERKSYPAVMAKALGAEHFNLSFAGKGVMRNYDTNDTDMYTSIYLRALGETPASAWTFGGSWVPDVVWIGLGGNDFDLGSPPRPAPDLSTFKTKYHELVTLVRQKNPMAHILCTVAASLTDDYPVGYNAYTNVTTILQEVVSDRHAAPYNDPKVHYFALPRADSSGVNGAPDLTGCEGHPNAAFHEKLGAAAAAKIKAITGW